MLLKMGAITACLYAAGRDQAERVNLMQERKGNYRSKVLKGCWYPAPQWRGLLPQTGLGTVDLNQDRGGSVCGQRQVAGLGTAQGRQRLLTCYTPTRRPAF